MHSCKKMFFTKYHRNIISLFANSQYHIPPEVTLIILRHMFALDMSLIEPKICTYESSRENATICMTLKQPVHDADFDFDAFDSELQYWENIPKNVLEQLAYDGNPYGYSPISILYLYSPRSEDERIDHALLSSVDSIWINNRFY